MSCEVCGRAFTPMESAWLDKLVESDHCELCDKCHCKFKKDPRCTVITIAAVGNAHAVRVLWSED